MNTVKVGAYIARCRRDKGLTQGQLADLLGVTNKAVSKWERGKGMPDVSLLPELSKLLGTSVDELLNGEAAKTDKPQAGAQRQGTRPMEKIKKRLAALRPNGRIVAGVALCLVGAGLLAMHLLYIVFGQRYNVMYFFGERMGYIFVATAFLLLGAGLAMLLWGRKAVRATSLLCAVAMVASLVFSVTAHTYYTHTVSLSPRGNHTLVLRTDKANGKTYFYRSAILWFAQASSQFPYPVVGEVKTQWLANDICAVTYLSDDDRVHQYIATYGRRDSGYSYVYVLAALQNHWSPADHMPNGWSLAVDKDKITVTDGVGEYQFTSDDCVQFGTLALALCRDGFPLFTLALNEDAFVDEDGAIRYGGTISLCPVSMSKTDAVVFRATDNPPEISAADGAPSPDKGKQMVKEMRAILAQDPTLESTSLRDGMYKIETALTDAYEIGFRAFEADVAGPGGAADENQPYIMEVQIETMRVLAGDEEDMLMEYNGATRTTDRAAGEVGESGYGLQMRIMRGEGVYLACRVERDTDGSHGLRRPDVETTYDTAADPRYYFFSPNVDAVTHTQQGVDFVPRDYDSSLNPYNSITEEDKTHIYLLGPGNGFTQIDKATGNSRFLWAGDTQVINAGFALKDGWLYFACTEFAPAIDAASTYSPQVVVRRMSAQGAIENVYELQTTQYPSSFGIYRGLHPWLYCFWRPAGDEYPVTVTDENTRILYVSDGYANEAPLAETGIDPEAFAAFALQGNSDYFNPMPVTSESRGLFYGEIRANDAWYSFQYGVVKRHGMCDEAGVQIAASPVLEGAICCMNYDNEWLYAATQKNVFRVSKENGRIEILATLNEGKEGEPYLEILRMDVVEGRLFLETGDGILTLACDGSTQMMPLRTEAA